MSDRRPEGSGPGPVGRRPRGRRLRVAGRRSPLSDRAGGVAVVAGFLILRSINDDDDGDGGEQPDG